MTSLSDELVLRLRERAQDPEHRSGDAGLVAGSVPIDEVLAADREELAGQPEEFQKQVADYLGGINSPLSGMVQNSVTGDGSQARGLLGALSGLLGGRQLTMMTGSGPVTLGRPAAATPAPAPASEQEVRAAEAALGFALPTALRQVYVAVANGGVGPGDGLYGLDQLVAKHREMTEEPVGPQGQDWPAALLPIQGDDWDVVSLDRVTGRVVYWDLEELDDDDELPPDQPTWAASFVPEADSLGSWLSAWLDS